MLISNIVISHSTFLGSASLLSYRSVSDYDIVCSCSSQAHCQNKKRNGIEEIGTVGV